MGNKGLYSVGKGMRKGTLKNNQIESFAGHFRLGLSHEWLMKSSLSKTLQIPAYASHVACFAGQHFWANREILIFISSLLNSHTQPLHKISQKYREMIEQNYNKIWYGIKANKKYSCKSQFYSQQDDEPQLMDPYFPKSARPLQSGEDSIKS